MKQTRKIAKNINHCWMCGDEITNNGKTLRCKSCSMQCKSVRKKISEANLRNPRGFQKGNILGVLNKGRHHTEKIKEKISASHIGWSSSPGTQFGAERGYKQRKGKDSSNWKGGPEVSAAKAEKQRRGYGFHKISFGFPGCVWHHVNKNDVVAILENIHKFTAHSVVGLHGIPAVGLEGVLG